MFDGFSHDNIFKIKLPRQDWCKHGHRWLNLILFQFWERIPLRSLAKTTLLRQSAIFLNEQSKSCDSCLKRERGRNLRSPSAMIWKPFRQSKIRKITSFPLTPRLYKTFQMTGQEIPWRIRTLLNAIRAINRRESFWAMKAKVFIEPKHDFHF